MVTLPTQLTTGENGSTQQQTADTINALITFLSQVVGGGAISFLTISNDTITPSTPFIRLEPEGGASSDDLKYINPQNLFDTGDTTAGRVLLLTLANTGKSITLKHDMFGTGRLLLPQSADYVLSTYGTVLIAAWDSSQSAWRVYVAAILPISGPLTLPTWDTAGRPAASPAGRMGYNQTLQRPEYANGVSWLPMSMGPAYTGSASLGSTYPATFTFSHGLGHLPLFTVSLRCASSDEGFSVDDELYAPDLLNSENKPTCHAVGSASAIKVYLRTRPRVVSPNNPNNTVQIDPTKWQLRVRAWRIA